MATGGKTGEGKADNAKSDSVKCKRCGKTGHKSVRCPGQVCGVCGGKGHSAEICANVVTVLACKDTRGCNGDSYPAISGEEEEVLMCNTPDEYSDESNDRGVEVCSLGRWRISRLFAIVGHRATCSLIDRKC